MGEAQKTEKLELATTAEFILLDAELQDPLPSWSLAADIFPELNAETRQEATRFLGGIAIRGETGEVITQHSNKASLMAATQLAAFGDKQARQVIYNNAAADVAERLFKAGHQTKITMRVVGGRLEQ
jgi:hypothetical protein